MKENNFKTINKEFKTIYADQIKSEHRLILANLLKEQGKVKGDLNNKVDKCKILCFVSIDNVIIGCGAIKVKTPSVFEKEKANLPEISSLFESELGYIYVKPENSGKGIASELVNNLLEEFGKNNLMATTEIETNPAMVNILEKNGFQREGLPWVSDIHPNFLGLFLKYA